ncbi:hypothetical protein ACQ4PT_044731 [Festuca glaucescens]
MAHGSGEVGDELDRRKRARRRRARAATREAGLGRARRSRGAQGATGVEVKKRRSGVASAARERGGDARTDGRAWRRRFMLEERRPAREGAVGGVRTRTRWRTAKGKQRRGVGVERRAAALCSGRRRRGSRKGAQRRGEGGGARPRKGRRQPRTGGRGRRSGAGVSVQERGGEDGDERLGVAGARAEREKKGGLGQRTRWQEDMAAGGCFCKLARMAGGVARIEIKKEHQVLMVNKTTSFKKQGKPKKGNFKKGGKKAAAPPEKPKAGPKPDTECYYCNGKGHWKRNCPKYLADLKSGLVKKKKVDTAGNTTAQWCVRTSSEGKIFVAKNGTFLEKEFLTKEVTGRKVELDEVTEPSLIDQSSAAPEDVPVPPAPITEEANDNDHETSSEVATEPRRSTRERTTPDWYDPCLNVMIVDNNDEDPVTYEEAMMSLDSNKWQEAMKSEMGSMYDNQVWTLVDLPDSRKAVENKWIFKRKTDADGNVTIKLDLSQRVSDKFKMDVKTAFLNGDIEEELYMVQPKGFVDPKNADKSGYVLILNGAAVSWCSSKQCTVAKSSTESEYIAASEASSEAVWMKRFIVELGVVPSALDPLVIYCDNMGAIANAQEPRSHKKLKHIKLRFHSIREYIEDGEFLFVISVKVRIMQMRTVPFTLLQNLLYGYAHEGLVFCDIQNADSYRPRSDCGRVGRITVTGGTLTSDEIIGVLQGLVLDDQFPWDIQPQGDNIYKTQFPSKIDLARATRFGTFLAKENSRCFVKFIEWKSEVKPTLRLDEVWVLISGVPEGLLRDYLALWGLCGMLGRTKAVEMAYTRRHEVVRAYVRVTDVSFIPFRKVIMYKGEGYELTFEIELDEDMLPADDAEDGNGNDGDQGGEDKGNEENNIMEEDKQGDLGSDKKNKGHVTKAGVILPSAITKMLLTTPSMKFGSFSDRWCDIMEADESRTVSPMHNAGRRLFSDVNEAGSTLSKLGECAGLSHGQKSDIVAFLSAAEFSSPVAAKESFSPCPATVADKSAGCDASASFLDTSAVSPPRGATAAENSAKHDVGVCKVVAELIGLGADRAKVAMHASLRLPSPSSRATVAKSVPNSIAQTVEYGTALNASCAGDVSRNLQLKLWFRW